MMIMPSSGFAPVILQGIKLYPDKPFYFDFIMDVGDTALKEDALKEESTRLVKYFLTALTIPENDLWVNLSPYEKDKIIPNAFGVTEMGRDLLSQDYLLKQLTASLIYPENEIGKKFWDRVYKKAYELYGTTQIPINTFNKVWIMPQKAVVYENGNTALVVKSHLKVMIEQDYLALQRQETRDTRRETRSSGLESQVSGLGADILKEIVIPEIEKEVNTGKNFAPLRQIFNSLILATWYKRHIKAGVLNKIYVDKNKTAGVDVEDKDVKQKIYDQYMEAFKKGVYNFIKEDYDEKLQEMVPRKYFSGGVSATHLSMDSDQLAFTSNPQAVPTTALASDKRLIATVRGDAVRTNPQGDQQRFALPTTVTESDEGVKTASSRSGLKKAALTATAAGILAAGGLLLNGDSEEPPFIEPPALVRIEQPARPQETVLVIRPELQRTAVSGSNTIPFSEPSNLEIDRLREFIKGGPGLYGEDPFFVYNFSKYSSGEVPGDVAENDLHGKLLQKLWNVREVMSRLDGSPQQRRPSGYLRGGEGRLENLIRQLSTSEIQFKGTYNKILTHHLHIQLTITEIAQLEVELAQTQDSIQQARIREQLRNKKSQLETYQKELSGKEQEGMRLGQVLLEALEALASLEREWEKEVDDVVSRRPQAFRDWELSGRKSGKGSVVPDAGVFRERLSERLDGTSPQIMDGVKARAKQRKEEMSRGDVRSGEFNAGEANFKIEESYDPSGKKQTDSDTGVGGRIDFLFDSHSQTEFFQPEIEKAIDEADVVFVEHNLEEPLQKVWDGNITDDEFPQFRDRMAEQVSPPGAMRALISAVYKSRQKNVASAAGKTKIFYGEDPKGEFALDAAKRRFWEYAVSDLVEGNVSRALFNFGNALDRVIDRQVTRDRALIKSIKQVKADHPDKNILIIRGAGHTGVYVSLARDENIPDTELTRKFLLQKEGPIKVRHTLYDAFIRDIYFQELDLKEFKGLYAFDAGELIKEYGVILARIMTLFLLRGVINPEEKMEDPSTRILMDKIAGRVQGLDDLRAMAPYFGSYNAKQDGFERGFIAWLRAEAQRKSATGEGILDQAELEALGLGPAGQAQSTAPTDSDAGVRGDTEGTREEKFTSKAELLKGKYGDRAGVTAYLEFMNKNLGEGSPRSYGMSYELDPERLGRYVGSLLTADVPLEIFGIIPSGEVDKIFKKDRILKEFVESLLSKGPAFEALSRLAAAGMPISKIAQNILQSLVEHREKILQIEKVLDQAIREKKAPDEVTRALEPWSSFFREDDRNPQVRVVLFGQLMRYVYSHYMDVLGIAEEERPGILFEMVDLTRFSDDGSYLVGGSVGPSDGIGFNLNTVRSPVDAIKTAIHEATHWFEHTRDKYGSLTGFRESTDIRWLLASALGGYYAYFMEGVFLEDVKGIEDVRRGNNPHETHIKLRDLLTSDAGDWSKVVADIKKREGKTGHDEDLYSYDEGALLAKYAAYHYGKAGSFFVRLYGTKFDEINFAQMELAAAVLREIFTMPQADEVAVKDWEKRIFQEVSRRPIASTTSYEDLEKVKKEIAANLSEVIRRGEAGKIPITPIERPTTDRTPTDSDAGVGVEEFPGRDELLQQLPGRVESFLKSHHPSDPVEEIVIAAGKILSDHPESGYATLPPGTQRETARKLNDILQRKLSKNKKVDAVKTELTEISLTRKAAYDLVSRVEAARETLSPVDVVGIFDNHLLADGFNKIKPALDKIIAAAQAQARKVTIIIEDERSITEYGQALMARSDLNIWAEIRRDPRRGFAQINEIVQGEAQARTFADAGSSDPINTYRFEMQQFLRANRDVRLEIEKGSYDGWFNGIQAVEFLNEALNDSDQYIDKMQKFLEYMAESYLLRDQAVKEQIDELAQRDPNQVIIVLRGALHRKLTEQLDPQKYRLFKTVVSDPEPAFEEGPVVGMLWQYYDANKRSLSDAAKEFLIQSRQYFYELSRITQDARIRTLEQYDARHAAMVRAALSPDLIDRLTAGLPSLTPSILIQEPGTPAQTDSDAGGKGWKGRGENVQQRMAEVMREIKDWGIPRRDLDKDVGIMASWPGLALLKGLGLISTDQIEAAKVVTIEPTGEQAAVNQDLLKRIRQGKIAVFEQTVSQLEYLRLVDTEYLYPKSDADSDAGVEGATTDSDTGLVEAPDQKGGIDFNPDALDIEVQREGPAMNAPVFAPNINNIQIDGLVPVMIKITPAVNLPAFLGISQNREEKKIESLSMK